MQRCLFCVMVAMMLVVVACANSREYAIDARPDEDDAAECLPPMSGTAWRPYEGGVSFITRRKIGGGTITIFAPENSGPGGYTKTWCMYTVSCVNGEIFQTDGVVLTPAAAPTSDMTVWKTWFEGLAEETFGDGCGTRGAAAKDFEQSTIGETCIAP